jgi:CO/xanthine dehydrogenase Mo-binding subunit
MADQKLVGQNYTPPDLVAKVTGRAKYAEDYRAEGMLFAKLLLSPMPHARVRHIDQLRAPAPNARSPTSRCIRANRSSPSQPSTN